MFSSYIQQLNTHCSNVHSIGISLHQCKEHVEIVFNYFHFQHNEKATHIQPVGVFGLKFHKNLLNNSEKCAKLSGLLSEVN
jgi:hypothetical protein